MARKTKNSNLSIEERLEQALIPNWDEPYKLPENWCWVKLGSVSKLYNGDRGVNYPSKKDYVSKGIPFINAGAIQNCSLVETEFNFISKEKYEALRAGKIEKNDILYCLRGSLGKTALIESNLTGAISSSLCIIRAKNNVIPKYLFYLLRSDFVVQQQNKAENGSAQPNLSAASVMEYILPLAPLEEQKRIISCVESLFSKLDETQEKAQEVVDGFETRKAAILHKAFSGELTKKWRKEHNIENTSWVIENLSNVCFLRSGTTIPTEEELEFGQIPYIKVSDMNLTENSIQITTSSRFINICPQSHLIPYGSTIFPKRGGAILTNKKRFIGVDKIIADLNIMAIIPDPIKLKGWYCYYWMLSVDLRKLYNGANVPQINNKDMVDLKIPVPTLEEQDEISRILDELLSKEQRAKETAEAVVGQTDMMKKAILARAFRGELGTNDPSEESAVELLKKVIFGGEN